MRALNGAAVPGADNSTIMELFSIAPWSPIPGNQPYLKPGRSSLVLMSKDIPFGTYFYNAHGGENLIFEALVDPQQSVARTGTHELKLDKVTPAAASPPAAQPETKESEEKK